MPRGRVPGDGRGAVGAAGAGGAGGAGAGADGGDGGRVRGVLLDVDDTLIDTRAAMHTAGAAAAAAAWPSADPARIVLAGKRFRDDPGGHFRAYTAGARSFAAMRRARIDDVAAWLGVPAGEDAAETFGSAYDLVFLEVLRPFADARACVERLREAGIAVGLLTNSGGDYTAVKLAATGLDDLCDVVCTRDTLGFGKPDPRAFHEACRRMGVAPGESAYVGDEVVPDALGAHRAGLAALLLVRDEQPDPAALEEVSRHAIPVVGSLAQVRPEAVRTLEPGCRCALGGFGHGGGEGSERP